MTDVLCIGGAAVDLGLRLEHDPVLGTSNLAAATEGDGGVARNVASLLARFGAVPALLTAVGADDAGAALLRRLVEAGVDAGRALVVAGAATARYVAVLDPSGELVIGVNAMGVTSAITPGLIASTPLDGASWVFAECNLDAPALAAVLERRRAEPGARLAVDTVSVPKCARLPRSLEGVDLLLTNADEAGALLRREAPRTREGGLELSAHLLDRGAAAAVVTLGDRGHVARTAEGAWWSGAVRARVADVTGAGDALIAATLAGLVRGRSLPEAAREGALAAALAVESERTAPDGLGLARLDAERARLDDTPWEGPLP